MKQLSMAINH